MTMRRVHFHVNPTKDGAAAVHAALAAALPRFGMEECASAAEADVVIALGGDGTILRAAHVNPPRPVVGFNLGGLGYLSAVERRDFEAALSLLKPQGLLTVCVYPGHDEGMRELNALTKWASHLDPRRFDALLKCYMNQPNHPPQLIAVKKK